MNCGVVPASPTQSSRRDPNPKFSEPQQMHPVYVTNHTAHTQFIIPYVSDVINEILSKHHNKAEAHPNPPLQPPVQPVNSRRLNRCWPLDLQGTGVDIAG